MNGQKKWIGNSPWCDISIIWARDVADNQVKGFIVENKTTPGFSVEKIQNKIRAQGGPERLDHAEGCSGAGRKPSPGRQVVPRHGAGAAQTRYMVAWEATGCQMGAYEHALKYAQERLQFGKPIGSFQLIQDLLAKMIANVTACQCLVVRTAQLDDEGKLTDAQAALSKAFSTAKCRETVAWGREIFGGNGISIDYNVGRFFTDAEALTPTKARTRCRT